jgi:FAS-associated factor 2
LKEREKMQKIEAEKIAQEEIKRLEKERDEVKAKLVEEPAADAADVVSLTLRVPSGERKTRRFLATDQVGLIYDFIRSLDDIGFEDVAADF